MLATGRVHAAGLQPWQFARRSLAARHSGDWCEDLEILSPKIRFSAVQNDYPPAMAVWCSNYSMRKWNQGHANIRARAPADLGQRPHRRAAVGSVVRVKRARHPQRPPPPPRGAGRIRVPVLHRPAPPTASATAFVTNGVAFRSAAAPEEGAGVERLEGDQQREDEVDRAVVQHAAPRHHLVARVEEPRHQRRS